MRNKILVWVFSILLFSIKAYSQIPEYETIFTKRADRKPSKIRGYGSLFFEYSPLRKANETYHFLNSGIQGGIIYDKKLAFGLYIAPIANIPDRFRNISIINPNVSTYSNQFGLICNFKPNNQKAIHLLYGLQIGKVNLFELTLDQGNNYAIQLENGLAVSPKIGLELNIFPWLATELSAGYRFTAGKENFGVNIKNDLKAPFLQFGFTFGKLR